MEWKKIVLHLPYKIFCTCTYSTTLKRIKWMPIYAYVVMTIRWRRRVNSFSHPSFTVNFVLFCFKVFEYELYAAQNVCVCVTMCDFATICII